MLSAVGAAQADQGPARGAKQSPQPVDEVVIARLCVSAPPVAQRTRGWTCTAAGALAVVGKTAPPSAVPASATSHCNAAGCWYRDSSIAAEFIQSAQFAFYAGALIGATYMHVVWKISGTSINEYATNRADFASEYPQWEGALYNGAHNDVGTKLRSCPVVNGPEEVPVNKEIASPAPFCRLADSANYDHHMVLGFSYQVDGYPGYWWVEAKSIVSHSGAVPATSYTFDSADTLPGDAFDHGWSP